MNAVAVKPLCGICVSRDGVVDEVVDGRRMFLCPSCSAEPVPDPDWQEERARGRLLTAIRWNPGATFQDLRDVLGVPNEKDDRLENQKYMQALVRLVKDGTVLRYGKRCEYQYQLARSGKR